MQILPGQFPGRTVSPQHGTLSVAPGPNASGLWIHCAKFQTSHPSAEAVLGDLPLQGGWTSALICTPTSVVTSQEVLWFPHVIREHLRQWALRV